MKLWGIGVEIDERGKREGGFHLSLHVSEGGISALEHQDHETRYDNWTRSPSTFDSWCGSGVLSMYTTVSTCFERRGRVKQEASELDHKIERLDYSSPRHIERKGSSNMGTVRDERAV